MNKIQAQRFLSDIRGELGSTDFCQDLYVSIRGVGTKTFKQSCCQSLDGWLFIWTEDESFCIKESEMGDFVCADLNESRTYTLKG